MNRLLISACTTLLACSLTGCRHKPKNRFDIALEGPWVVYQETRFQNNGKHVTVLVAIAPNGAIDYNDVGSVIQYPSDGLHHRPPQLSTGDGYYVINPDIYCLTFDDQCAPEGSAALNFDGYPESMLLTMNSHDPTGPPAAWDWFSAVNGLSDTVLILPMPNSVSNDGVWPMRFARKFDPNGIGYGDPQRRSIGLVLHYSHGPKTFNLRSCEGKPSVANCDAAPKDRNTKMPLPPKTTELINTGTLRISMKAPSNEDACDGHVRMAYPEMLKLLNNNYNTDKAVIEPAQGTRSDGSPIFEGGGNGNYCFTKEDTQGQHMLLGGHAPDHMPDISILLGQIDDIIKAFDGIPQALRDSLLLPEIKSSRDGLDPNFPRISQIERIGALVRLSTAQIDVLLEERRKKSSAKVGLHGAEPGQTGLMGNADLTTFLLTGPDYDKLMNLRTAERPAAEAPPTKNGNDCKAAIMFVGP
jgi:hypothetical protein